MEKVYKTKMIQLPIPTRSAWDPRLERHIGGMEISDEYRPLDLKRRRPMKPANNDPDELRRFAGPFLIVRSAECEPTPSLELGTFHIEFAQLLRPRSDFERRMWLQGEVKNLLVHAWSRVVDENRRRVFGPRVEEGDAPPQLEWMEPREVFNVDRDSLVRQPEFKAAARTFKVLLGQRASLSALVEPKLVGLPELLERVENRMSDDKFVQSLASAAAHDGLSDEGIRLFAERFGFLNAEPHRMAAPDRMDEVQVFLDDSIGAALRGSIPPHGESIREWRFEVRRLSTLRSALKLSTGALTVSAGWETKEKPSHFARIQFGGPRAKGVPEDEFELDVYSVGIGETGFVDPQKGKPLHSQAAWSRIRAHALSEVDRILARSVRVVAESCDHLTIVPVGLRGALYLSLLSEFSDSTVVRRCGWCGKTIEGRVTHARYCSDKCKIARRNRDASARRKAKLKPL